MQNKSNVAIDASVVSEIHQTYNNILELEAKLLKLQKQVVDAYEAGGSVLSNVELPEKTRFISQESLRFIRALEAEKENIDTLISNQKKRILKLLLKGAKIERGSLTARLIIPKRKEIDWKSLFVQYVGAAVAKEIIDKTEPKACTPYFKIEAA